MTPVQQQIANYNWRGGVSSVASAGLVSAPAPTLSGLSANAQSVAPIDNTKKTIER
jgi:hypothetical protein